MTASGKRLAKRIAITGGLEAANLLRAARRDARRPRTRRHLHAAPCPPARSARPSSRMRIWKSRRNSSMLRFDRLKKDGYRFVALDEVPCAAVAVRQAIKPFAAFTLDDGYRNNLVYALPIFERHEAPFTVFVAKGLSERTHSIWWETLAAAAAPGRKARASISATATRCWTSRHPADQGTRLRAISPTFSIGMTKPRHRRSHRRAGADARDRSGRHRRRSGHGRRRNSICLKPARSPRSAPIRSAIGRSARLPSRKFATRWRLRPITSTRSPAPGPDDRLSLRHARGGNADARRQSRARSASTLR